jgi:hypothetical protein
MVCTLENFRETLLLQSYEFGRLHIRMKGPWSIIFVRLRQQEVTTMRCALPWILAAAISSNSLVQEDGRRMEKTARLAITTCAWLSCPEQSYSPSSGYVDLDQKSVKTQGNTRWIGDQFRCSLVSLEPQNSDQEDTEYQHIDTRYVSTRSSLGRSYSVALVSVDPDGIGPNPRRYSPAKRKWPHSKQNLTPARGLHSRGQIHNYLPKKRAQFNSWIRLRTQH